MKPNNYLPIKDLMQSLVDLNKERLRTAYKGLGINQKQQEPGGNQAPKPPTQ